MILIAFATSFWCAIFDVWIMQDSYGRSSGYYNLLAG